MRTHTAEDIEHDLSLLWAYRSEGLSQSELAEREGMSQGHLSRRLARARRYEAELDRQSRREAESAGLDRFDYPYMELVTGPGGTSGEWCQLDGHAASMDRGKVHIGGKVRSLTYGQVTTEETGPTSYQPDPSLKGGVG